LLLDDDLGEILEYLVVDSYNLLSNGYYFFEGLVESYGLFTAVLIRDGKHLEGLINNSFVFERDKQLKSCKAIMQHFE
jgi:hypothetical protein